MNDAREYVEATFDKRVRAAQSFVLRNDERGAISPAMVRHICEAFAPDMCPYGIMQAETPSGGWEPAIPEPFSFGLFQWLRLRLTGWRDDYGRKAQLFWR